jgi:hypothetical protein
VLGVQKKGIKFGYFIENVYLCIVKSKSHDIMATIVLNPSLYSQAQSYAKADGMSVE